jgi:flagellar basal body rod protein FlgG
MELVANNLANVNTSGFKQEKGFSKSLANAMESANIQPDKELSDGNMPITMITDFTGGSLQETGRKLDFAIKGDAFFEVQTAAGDKYYTRNGSFKMDSSASLIDDSGNKVIGVAGEMKMVGGEIDQPFYLVSFKQKDALVSQGKGLYSAPQQAGLTAAVEGEVLQGVIENSNTDLIDNMAEMIAVAREYSLNCQMLSSQDEILKKATEEVGALR